MATKALHGSVQDGNYREIDGSVEDISDLDESQESELRGVLNELNSDPDAQNVYVKVFKFVDGQPKPYECGKFNVTEVDELSDKIRTEFGSGKYRVNVIRNGKLFKIIDYPILAPSTAVSTGQSDIAAVLRALQESQERQFQQLTTVLKNQNGNPVGQNNDPITMMTAMMTAMSKMRELMPQPPENNNFELVLKGIELAKDMNNGGGDTSFMDVLRDLVKPMAPMIGEAMQKQAAQRITVPAGGQYQTPIPDQPTNQSQEETGQMSLQEQMIRAFINKLVHKAKTGGDPGLQADNILEDVPQAVIVERLLLPTTIDELGQVNPDVLQHRPWFEQLQGYLYESAIERGWVAAPAAESERASEPSPTG